MVDVTVESQTRLNLKLLDPVVSVAGRVDDPDTPDIVVELALDPTK